MRCFCFSIYNRYPVVHMFMINLPIVIFFTANSTTPKITDGPTTQPTNKPTTKKGKLKFFKLR